MNQTASMSSARRVGLIITATVLVAAIVFVIVLIIYHSKQSQIAKARGLEGPNAPVSVATATVTQGDMPVTIPALGTVTPLVTVTVKTQISGLLTQVAFKEGQMVRG